MSRGHDKDVLLGIFSQMPQNVSNRISGEKSLAEGDYIMQLTGSESWRSAKDGAPIFKDRFRVLVVVDGNDKSLEVGDEAAKVWKITNKNKLYFQEHVQALCLWGGKVSRKELKEMKAEDYVEAFVEGGLDGCLVRVRVKPPYVSASGDEFFDPTVIPIVIEKKELSKEAQALII